MPALSLQLPIWPSLLFDLGVAVSAVDRSAPSRLEGHFCFLAACSADYGEHLSPGGAVARGAVALGLPGSAARLAALGVIGIASLGKQFLLAGAEGESAPTVGALDGFVHKAHRMTSFLNIFG